MKMRNFLLYSGLTLTMALGGVACDDDDNGNGNGGTGGTAGTGGNGGNGDNGGNGGTGGITASQTIGEVIIAGNDFTIFEDALQQANLLNTLDDEGDAFTVFAPTDAAFQLLIDTLNANAVSPNPHDQDADGDFDRDDLLALPTLTDILTYHVVSGERLSASEVASQAPSTLTTVEGSDLQTGVGMMGNTTTLFLDGTSAVITGDIQAANGTVHVIDAVLFPPDTFPGTLVERLQVVPNFSMAVTALQDLDLVGDLATASDVTVFAPPNSAFIAVPNLNDITSDAVLFTNTLLFHVLPVELRSDALVTGPQTTLIDTLGDATTFNSSLDVTADANGIILTSPSGTSTARVVGADLDASNGTIHVINSVLLPDTL